MRVFIVTTGEYSDYRIRAVYSNREEADKAASLIGGNVEEFAVDKMQFLDDPGMDFFTVIIDRKGNASVFYDSRLKEDGEKHEIVCYFRTNKDGYCGKHPLWNIQWQGYAKSEKHAVRHAEELRRQILAGQRPAEVDMGKN